MPKIPVYQSQAAPTASTGMVSYTRAQMDSRPFIQAALAKAETQTTAATMISTSLDGRIKAEGDLAAGNALMAAEAAMQSEVSSLKRAPDLTAVFGQDLTSDFSWQGAVNDIQTSLSDKLSPYAKKKFATQFGALSAQYGAQLRVAIDERTDKELVGNLNLSMQNFELSAANISAMAEESEVVGMSPAEASSIAKNEYDMQLRILNSKAFELAASGRIDLDTFAESLIQMRLNMAEQAMTLLINEHDNPLIAYKKLRSGLYKGKGAALDSLSNSHPMGFYAIGLLTDELINPATRNELVEKLGDMAHKLHERNEQERTASDKRLKEQSTKTLNSLFEPGITPEEYKFKLEILRSLDFITPQTQKLLDALEVDPNAIFRTTDEGDDNAVLVDLYQKKSEGILTVDNVVEQAANLTRQSFGSLMDAAGGLVKEEKSDIMNRARNTFRYFAESGDDIEDFETKSRRSYFNVLVKMDDFKRDIRTTKKRPATKEELSKQMDIVIADEKKNLDNVIIVELNKRFAFLERLLLIAVNQNGENPKPFPRIDGKIDLSQALSHLASIATSHPKKADQISTHIPEIRYHIDLLGEN